jgi:hypothetical protein
VRLVVPPPLALPAGIALAWWLAQTAPPAPQGPPAPLAPPAPAGPATPAGPPAPAVPPAPVERFMPAVRPHIRAVRTSERPVIDGKLDDPAWRSAPPSATFTQHFPNEGDQPSERTELRVLYDDDAVYIGIDCEQVHSPVVKRLMRRDTQLPSDGVWLDIDSRRDGVSAFHFGVNAAGVLSDAIHFNDLDYSSDWDAVWEGKAADTPRGYSVEMRIPLYVLRFEALPIQDWGLEVRRFVEARQETDDWAFFPRSAGSYIPWFGRIDALANLRPRRAWQLRPFELGRLRHRSAGAVAEQGTLAHGWDFKLSGGLDAKISVTNELALDLTVLPDFGQVEADSVVLNLSTYETFFPEKRPFFLEGIDTFATLRQLLYTRRIGHVPPAPTLAPNEQLVDLPEPSTIYGAAKLVGTIGGRTTLGVLSAVTGQNDVDVQTPQGRVAKTVEPLSAYNVVRWKRLVGADSSVGLLATATTRFEPLYHPNQLCPETNAAPAPDQRCTNDAYAVSADGRWRSPEGDYVLGAQALATALVHGPPRHESDGIDVDPGKIAGGASVDFDKVGGKHWLWSADQQISGRQLEYNDLGYLDRKNDFIVSYALTYRTVEPWWRTVETRTTFAADYRGTLDGIDLPHGLSLTSSWILANYWTVVVQGDLRGAWHDDRELNDGTGRALERAARQGLELTLAGDPRRRVLWSAYAQAMHMNDGLHAEARGDLTVRALPQLELELTPTSTYDHGEPRYVSTAALLGAQDARSLGATLRAAYTFTPELTLQVYSQAFLARIHYTRFFNIPDVGNRGRINLASLTPAPAQDLGQTDTLSTTLNVNVVLRWEFRLGSIAYLVYTRAQTPVLTPNMMNGATSLDPHPILNGSAAIDVIMLKIAYWFG